MVEHRVLEKGVYDTMGANVSAVIGEDAPVLWRTGSRSEQLTPPVWSLAAICAVQKLSKDLEEYNKTSSLGLSHPWDAKGSELLCDLCILRPTKHNF